MVALSGQALTDEALRIVTNAPRDDWGWRWLVMADVLKRYDPSRGGLENYFARAARFKAIDELRKETGCRRRGRKPSKFRKMLLGLDKLWEPVVRAVEPCEPRPFYLPPDELEFMGLMARGLTTGQAALAMGEGRNSIRLRAYRAARANR